ncbi:hypothetical protein [Mycolicibacterium neoaurum]|uniref:hypothetical protein n=1 Tax=Mycolicibacterium neoaurum TaxID=1795 RepID=UPI001F4D102F|nr:hypothetical protein [Mycolicibacterium neoaurum]
MTNFFQDKGTEAAKLFSGIFIYGLFAKWDVIPKDYFAGELVKIIADAIISFLVVFLIVELALGRPRINLEWRSNSKERPLSGDVPVATKNQIINLQLKADRETALQKLLLRLSSKRNFRIEVAFHPEGMVTPIRQDGTDSFVCEGKRIVFDGLLIDSGSMIGAANFTLKHQRPDYEHPVTIKVTACWNPKLCKLPVKLTRIEKGIDKIILGG